MPFHRNDKRNFRRSRSRSPYARNPPYRRSRSPRPNQRRTGVTSGPRDFGRAAYSYSSKERGRHGRSMSPTRRSPTRRSPQRRSPPRRSPRRSRSRSPERKKHIHPPKPVMISFPEDDDFEREDFTKSSKLGGRLGIQSLSSSRGQDHLPHMDRIPSRPKIEEKISKKRITLNERFSINQRKFELEENITIGLQRNPNVPISTVVNVESKDFDFNKFTLKRRADEGLKPIFDRPEVRAFRHDENLDDQDDFERRVITVLPTRSERQGRDSTDVDYSIRKSLSANLSHDEERHWGRGAQDSHNFSVRRGRDETSYRGEKIQITRMRTPSPRREPQVRLDPRPDPRYEAKFRANRDREEGPHRKMERIETISHNPNDLRHSLLNRRISNPSDDARFKIESKRQDHNEPKQTQGRDAWEVASEFHRDKSQRRPSSDVRNVLPDFKNREGRFDYEEWKDKPEMVPKGISYFEHDNRGEDRGFRGRGRGRGRFNLNARRFSSSRGGYRPRPYTQPFNRDKYSSRDHEEGSYRRDNFRPRGRGTRFYSGGLNRRSSVEREEWKHDLFDKLEKDDDNCPTSTT